MKTSRFNELLFENRNKSYGAYAIRSDYKQNLLLSFSISVLLFFFAGFTYKFFRKEQVLQTKQEQVYRLLDSRLFTETAKTNSPKKKVVANSGKVKKNSSPKSTNYIPTEKDSTSEIIQNTYTFNVGSKNDSSGTNTDSVGYNPYYVEVETKKEEPLLVADIQPEFPGGIKKLIEYLTSNIKYPEIAKENRIQGTVYIQFIVDANGKVSTVKNLNKVAGGCSEEAIRVIEKMPDWKPGVFKGKSVAVLYNLPVKFSLGL